MRRCVTASTIKIGDKFSAMRSFRILIFMALLIGDVACTSQPAAKHYKLDGKVVTIDKQSQSVVVDAKDIPGFMPAMAMPYKVRDPVILDQLLPGDLIEGDLVVQTPDYWLETVRVTQHATGSAANSAAGPRIPLRGDVVPNFSLTNQNNRRISLRQYRGKVLLVTFIYTRCPFPDYCPRITHLFNELNRQLLSDAGLKAKTHLLSVSFDPEHDTAAVLHDYAFSQLDTTEPALFRHWEFAVPSAKELPSMANFFGFTYVGDHGMITHSLSTAVIGPDGRIFSWYHGSDWQVSDLARDVAAALHLSA